MTNEQKEKRNKYYQEYISKEANWLRKQKYMLEYESSSEVKQQKKMRATKSYNKNREQVIMRSTMRRQVRKNLVDKICMTYKCQNPNCKWNGEFTPYQLSFHHFDSSQKITEIAKMYFASYKTIATEINKCIVLCRNCHSMADKGDIILNESMLCKVNNQLEIITNEIQSSI